MRLSWAASLLLPALGAQAAVVFTTLYSFTGGDNDAHPQAGLVQGSDGNFYGTTYGHWGGYGPDYGTVFKISSKGALTTLHSFTGTNDGANPQAALVQGSDGCFYGTTVFGGTNFGGTVFKISTNGALTSLYSFGGNDGAYPYAGLVQGSDGYFYGTTRNGGTNGGGGTVFRISTNGALTTLYSFSGPFYSVDGILPSAGLVQGNDGNFYGTTMANSWNFGDLGGGGTVFQISPKGALTTLYSFGSVQDDGGRPTEAMVQGSDGNFYGTTEIYGANGYGTVFKISTNGTYASLYSLTGTNDDGPPNGLVQGSDGNLYGTTLGDDTGLGPNYGTVFKISPTGALTTLYSLSGNDGACPSGALVLGSDGDFYGTTYGDMWDANGTVFRLTIVPDPQLSIIPSGPYVILTWPTNSGAFSYAGYTLQSTTNLSLPVWTTNSPGPVVIGGQNVVINTISGTQKFYRLIR